MNDRHLDADAMDRYLAGERGAEAGQHLGACAQCREALELVDLALARFRGSAKMWAENAVPAEPWVAQTLPRRRFVSLRWAAVAAAGIVLAAVPLYRNYETRRAAAQARADTLLLEEVSADISRPAPEPLEPLIELVSQSSTGENR
jgi:hypothetical protein